MNASWTKVISKLKKADIALYIYMILLFSLVYLTIIKLCMRFMCSVTHLFFYFLSFQEWHHWHEMCNNKCRKLVLAQTGSGM